MFKHNQYKNVLKELSGNDLTERMRTYVDDLKQKQAAMQERFDGWIKVQDGIAARNEAIEFRRAGAIRYDLFKGNLGSEKAVDVKLAADMIVLKDNYDIALIISGDQDYVPAVQVVKDFGKHVYNVAFRKRDGGLLPGGARRLNLITDKSIEVQYDEFKSYSKLLSNPRP